MVLIIEDSQLSQKFEIKQFSVEPAKILAAVSFWKLNLSDPFSTIGLIVTQNLNFNRKMSQKAQKPAK